ncbi:MFS transporter [Rhodococcus jostii]|uniref:MFS transporter n=1 Tax=Rhodococcus jostii TaxID=132919 RepID=A0ABU4CUD5_RHOJO|nr:MFS transporter [Rhodococcus jostii]MDV6286825.1 MFS transporter [Rhodococcus jostii]
MFVCAAAGFTTLLDSAVLGIGVPAIRSSLHAGTADVQWILASYSLTFGLALVPAGRMGDLVGLRRLFLAGLVLFALMGVVGALAAEPWTVVLARLGQGIGAGMVSSQVLGLIADRFTGTRRARALGAYGTAGGLAGLVGPVLGGVLLGSAGPDVGWRLLLVLNVPFAVTTLVFGVVVLPRDRRSRAGAAVDVVGLGALAAATVLLLLPMVSGFGAPWPVVSVLAAAGAVGFFGWWERRYASRGHTPLLPPALMRARGFTLGTAVALFWFGAVLAMNAVVTLYLIEGLGIAPLHAALAMSGSAVMMAVTSAFGWRVVGRFGRAAVVGAIVAALLVVAGYVVAVNVVPRPYVLAVFATPAVVSGVAGGFVDAPNRAMTLEYAPPGASGVAAGFLQLSQRLSATVSLAAVPGLYLAAVADDAGNYGRAMASALTVCVGMLLVLLMCAVADGRRRKDT